MLLRQRDFPRTVWVKDEPWEIRFVRRLANDEGQQVAGLADPLDKTIYIRLGQTPIERLRTFVHEVMHAFEEEYGFSIPHSIVEALEDPIIFFILENCCGQRTS